MSWGAYAQDKNLSEIDRLGSELSIRLHCPVHFPAYNKNLFECMCGVIFPLYVVRGHDWEILIQKHDEERKLIRE